MFQFKGVLHYIVMTEPESTGYISVDNCKHKPVYPDHEWVCSLCGKVLSVEEVEEIQRGSAEITTVTTYEDLGLNPHGRTPLWLQGLGTIEGYQYTTDNGNRDDISILSNIAAKLELPSYAALEFLQLYKAFVKDKKRDRVCATLLALFTLIARYSEIERRIRSIVMEDLASVPDQVTAVGTSMPAGTAAIIDACIDYIYMVVTNNFGTSARSRIPMFRILYSRRELLRRVARIARMKGAATALKNYSMEVI